MDSIEKQKQVEEMLRGLAAGINGVINEQVGEMGFALIVFEFGRLDIGHYISNAERREMITTLRETADRLEKNQDIPPAHTTIQ